VLTVKKFDGVEENALTDLTKPSASAINDLGRPSHTAQVSSCSMLLGGWHSKVRDMYLWISNANKLDFLKGAQLVLGLNRRDITSKIFQ